MTQSQPPSPSTGETSRKHVVTTVERPDLIGTAAAWIWNAFWRKDGSTLADIEALVASSNATVGPSQCMLLLIDGVPVGTAGLIGSDLDSRPELTPWLAAMYVEPQWRGRGYALDLIGAVEAAAVRSGYRRVWLYTYVAEGLYLKAGWRSVERFEEGGAPAVLMCRDL